MATKDQIAYNVLNLLEGGHSKNTPMLSIRQIKFIIDYYRSLLIRRAIEKGDRLEEFEQTFRSVKFRVVHKSEAGNFAGYATTKPVLRSTNIMPKPVRLKGYPGFTYIGDADLARNFDVLSPHEIRFQATWSRFTRQHPRSCYFDDRIWIVNPPGYYNYDTGSVLNIIDTFFNIEESSGGYPTETPITTTYSDPCEYLFAVRGVFENPEEAAEFNGEDLTDYPVPADMVQQIVQSILNGEFRFLTSRPDDVIIDTLNTNRERSVQPE